MLTNLAALFIDSPGLFSGSVFVLGLVVGSFLNVVIYRLPIMLDRDWRAQAADMLSPTDKAETTMPAVQGPPDQFSRSTRGSACPACKTPIKAWQNIPVVSWLLLRG